MADKKCISCNASRAFHPETGRTMQQNNPHVCNIVFAKHPEDEIREIVIRKGEIPSGSLPKRLRRLSMWTRNLERKRVLVRERRKADTGMPRIYLVAVGGNE